MQAKDARGQLHEQLGGLTQDHGALIVYTSGTTGRPKGKTLPIISTPSFGNCCPPEVASFAFTHLSVSCGHPDEVECPCCRCAGALHSHGNLAAHIHALVTSWEWRETDRILHALPLHHVHGIINALHCAHAAGAAVEFLPSFSPAAVWARLMVGRSLQLSSPRVHHC